MPVTLYYVGNVFNLCTEYYQLVWSHLTIIQSCKRLAVGSSFCCRETTLGAADLAGFSLWLSLFTTLSRRSVWRDSARHSSSCFFSDDRVSVWCFRSRFSALSWQFCCSRSATFFSKSSMYIFFLSLAFWAATLFIIFLHDNQKWNWGRLSLEYTQTKASNIVTDLFSLFSCSVNSVLPALFLFRRFASGDPTSLSSLPLSAAYRLSLAGELGGGLPSDSFLTLGASCFWGGTTAHGIFKPLLNNCRPRRRSLLLSGALGFGWIGSAGFIMSGLAMIPGTFSRPLFTYRDFRLLYHHFISFRLYTLWHVGQ